MNDPPRDSESIQFFYDEIVVSSQPLNPTGCFILFKDAPTEENLSVFFALSASPIPQLTFPFAFEDAGDAFWRSALRGDIVQPIAKTYFERERN